ncbi:C-C chemokine receptor type 7-like [Aulostomus maculatus]
MTTVDYVMTEFTTEGPFSSSPTPTEYDYGDEPDLMCDLTPARDFQRLYKPMLYWLIALVGGAGNLAVIWIYLNFRHRLKTMTDVYLLNLAVADLLFLITLPLWATEAIAEGWSFGSALCKVNSALYKINLFSSMLLLTCISFDRYVVIVQTTKAQNSQMARLRCSRLVCVGVWFLAIVLATPELVLSTAEDDSSSQQYCRMVYYHMGNRIKILVLLLQVSVGFCLPILTMTFCYSAIYITLFKTRNFQKHKAMRVILAVVFTFVVTQLPYNSVLLVKVAQASNTTQSCEPMKRFIKVEQVLKTLAYTHACLNPFLYAFVGHRFRRDLQQLLRCCCPPAAPKTQSSKLSKGVLSSARASVMSDSDTSQALSL